MQINVFGLGYVGCVSAVCLARSGHTVRGIDIDPLKVSMINSGQSPIVEPGLQDAIQEVLRSGKLQVSQEALAQADVSLICVGTPSNENGSLKLDFVVRVVEQIGGLLRDAEEYQVINVRSTVLPGTVEKIIIPLLEARSGKLAGRDFGVCMNPEFMREGSSIHDFYHPPFTVIGELDERSGDQVRQLYGQVQAPLIRTTIRTAEMLKYACNAFHALKVTFANEIGNICKRLDIDSHELMGIFCQDQKLNLSPYYLKPGFAFGGSCLPKDLRALLYQARGLDLEAPVLDSILRSNRRQVDLAFKMVERAGKKSVGVLGLSFKPGSDDLRESPIVELVERLIGKGYNLSIFDREVSLARIFGSNKRYIDCVIPHISSLIRDSVETVIESSEILVVSKENEEFTRALYGLNSDRTVIDLVRMPWAVEQAASDSYQGICW